MGRCIHSKIRIKTHYEGTPFFMWRTQIICVDENRVLRIIFSNEKPTMEGF